MTFVRSLVFNVCFFGITIFLLIVCLPAPLISRGAVHAVSRVWCRATMGLLRGICGLDYRIVGREKIPDGPVIVASKHQSAWDTLVMPLLLHEPAYVLKKELTAIPLFGWFLKAAEQIPIDRSAGPRVLRDMIDASQEVFADRRPLLIYPEGTRVPPGKTGKYFTGVGALYAKLGVPVVPVALNSGVFWGRRSFEKRPGTITLEFLDPIPAGLPARDFLTELETRIETAVRRLENEANAA